MRIVVTRPQAQASSLVERLERLGHEVVVCPLIEIEPLGDEPIDLGAYDWVVVTSPNGAAELVRRLRGRLPRVAAIGPGTTAVLRTHGIEPALAPRVSTQEGLLAEFPRPPGRVAFAGAEDARRVLIDELSADFIPLYRTIERRPPTFPHGDLVLLTSASAARAFGALELDLPALSIGPSTSAAAKRSGVTVVAEAETHDLDGLIRAVAARGR
ncbi:MAG: uroporphyrinogen-III synthase [Actinobacteria bacterium]|nr:uroporphyrinogen-III synthase [Actinomycetota bacterium]